jgi:hypothetical protein
MRLLALLQANIIKTRLSPGGLKKFTRQPGSGQAVQPSARLR